ncbi:hypothetical protein WA026_022441 [Henosepilachna vigintioctopunctata]|uniref:Uncharacterized protein n=1 Tax=Henosepilachna vigintioctopunctata TaxID=420089 RepID=A0AAW1U7N4_9CUCU
MSSSEYSSTYVMEDSGFEDSGDTYGDYLRNSDSSSNTSSIYQLPPAARIRTLDQLINALLIEDQKQRQGVPSAELNPIPIERLPIPGNKENQRLSDSSSNTSSIYQLPPAARIRTLDQLINALLIEDQKQRQGDPSAELNPMPIERLPIPGNKENQRLSDSSSNTSSINQSPPAARITSLDQLINVLLNQAQKQQQGDPSAKLNPIPIERLPIPGNKENQRLVQWDSDDSSNTSSIYQLPPAARITSLDQLINILEKENQKQQQGDPSAKLNLIPIERLPIPGNKENQRLVQWDSDDRNSWRC